MSIRVVLVEDDAELRKLTASLLNYIDDIECVSTFGSAEEFVKSLPYVSADVVLMDIGLPGQNGIECIQKQHPLYPGIEFVMFTTHTDSREIFDALAAGAVGYVLKGGRPEQLAQAIREVRAGGSPMSYQIARKVTESFQRTEHRLPTLEKLTPREWEVVTLLCEGLAYKMIADRQHVSEHTVRTQVRSIYHKLEIHTRAELMLLMQEQKRDIEG